MTKTLSINFDIIIVLMLMVFYVLVEEKGRNKISILQCAVAQLPNVNVHSRVRVPHRFLGSVDVALVEIVSVVAGISRGTSSGARLPRASLGELALVDEMDSAAPAVLLGGLFETTWLLLRILLAVSTEESSRSLLHTLVLLALAGCALAVGVLAVSARRAHVVGVTVVHGGACVPVSLVVVVLVHVALEVGSLRALAVVGGFRGDRRGRTRGGGWACVHDLAAVLVGVAHARLLLLVRLLLPAGWAPLRHAISGLEASRVRAGRRGPVLAARVLVASSGSLAVHRAPDAGVPRGPRAGIAGLAHRHHSGPPQPRVGGAVAASRLASRWAHRHLGAVGGGHRLPLSPLVPVVVAVVVAVALSGIGSA